MYYVKATKKKFTVVAQDIIQNTHPAFHAIKFLTLPQSREDDQAC
jgi:hypothetical protein